MERRAVLAEAVRSIPCAPQPFIPHPVGQRTHSNRGCPGWVGGEAGRWPLPFPAPGCLHSRDEDGKGQPWAWGNKGPLGTRLLW